MSHDLLTGIQGRLPAGWTLLPLKRVAAIRYGLGQPPPEVSGGIPLLRATNVKRGTIADEGLIFVDPNGVPFGRDARLKPGEIIVVRSGAYTGDSAIVPERFDQALAGYDMVVTAKLAEPRFLAWQFLSSHVEDYQFSLSKSRAAQPHLNSEELGETLVCLPSLSGQRLIADFLDRETAKIDRLIAKQTEFLTLLDEHRRAMVTEAVTKGLDPSVTMQRTGISSLPSIPSHWRVSPLKRLAVSWCDGPFGSGLKSDHYTDHGIRVIRLQNIGEAAFFDTDQAFVSTEHFESLGGHDVRPCDLLIAGLGDEGNPLGRACVYPADGSPAMVKADCFRIRLRDDAANPDFVANYLSSAVARGLISEVARGSTRDRINLSAAVTLAIPVPPLSEQKVIVATVSDRLDQVTTIHTRSTEMIDRLRERRSALITAAVTGQIDVTQTAPALAAA